MNVSRGQHVVSLDPVKVTSELVSVVQSQLNDAFLNDQILKAKYRLLEALPNEAAQVIETRSLADGLREYNLAFRREMLRVLTELQDRRISDLRAELGFTDVPPSTFNPQREVQNAYDDLKNLARNRTTADGYVDKVAGYLRGQVYPFVIFDLHLSLRSFYQVVGTHTVYAVFHEICRDQEKYPLFSVEIDAVDSDQAMEVRSVRDVVMINTPAINSFEFDTVLTTPRACRFAECLASLSGIERFLQAKFKVSDSFILQAHYRPLVAEGLPCVRFRIGLQAVKDEDRRILDYSELITSLDAGAGHKFMDLVTRYVDGKVQSTADEVDRQYKDLYPRRSAERLVPRHLMVPMPLNETQRRILTAFENPKNAVIVVDGPPGTGKSYTITALVYLANQLGKSVMITSHKRQALDVIDQALTEQFKKLHPQAKPSVLRLQKDRTLAGINNLENTLSTQAINAARRRMQALNKEAIEQDRERLYAKLSHAHDRYWLTADDYERTSKMTLEWSQLHESLVGSRTDLADLVPPRLPPGTTIDVEAARKLASRLAEFPISASVESLGILFKEQSRLPDMLKYCDELNRLSAALPPGLTSTAESVPPEITSFSQVIGCIAPCLEPDALIKDCLLDEITLTVPRDDISSLIISHSQLLQARDAVSKIVEYQQKFFGRLFKANALSELKQSLSNDQPGVAELLNRTSAREVLDKLEDLIRQVEEIKSRYTFLSRKYILSGGSDCPPSELQDLLRQLGSLEFQPVVSLIVQLRGKPIEELTIAQLSEMVRQLTDFERYQALHRNVEEFALHIGMTADDLPKLYGGLKQANDLLNRVQREDVEALEAVFRFYAPLLEAISIVATDISSLNRIIADAERANSLFRYINLHAELSAHPMAFAPDSTDIDDYLEKNQKILQHQADQRFSNLLNYAPDVQRILTAISAGKRISPEQAGVLLSSLSCVISEPKLISRHFPMEQDMIDLLIIDEASQVSIAESISLMLRAKQTIVFGDELQYGAVGAVNVSRRYSEYYFKDILRDYADDRSVAISEAEQERLAREASEEPDEETAESSTLIPIDPGTREWLKTFSVRTSTLAFAKALQNYSASLNVHFRSFPEIISYSNDVFYRPSQIELVTNRIRTKPIGQVLRFIKVETKGLSGRNVNLDEIEAIQRDIEATIGSGYKGTIGIICSFKEQQARMEELFRKEMSLYPDLVREHKFTIWFVGEVQGEERDLVYYSFVQDKKLDNADLRTIYPAIGGTADNIRRLKMQRLNVGFSRAKDIMVFVHSMPLGEYSDTRLGDALRHYDKVRNAAHDHYVSDESVFGSPAEKELYALIIQTPFFRKNLDKLRLIAQFEIGKYIRQEYHRYIPKYRVDFLLTKTDGGKEKSLIIEYDGLEFHTNNPDIVTAHNFDREYLEYDVERQLELESYGYSFLRINKFSLVPRQKSESRVAVLNEMLEESFK